MWPTELQCIQELFEGRARFPRSKKFKDYRSLTYPQSGFKLGDGRLHLSKIGKVRIFQATGRHDREHRCMNCEADIPRDLNSALLIRKLGILSCSPSDGGLSPAEPKPLPMRRLRIGQAAASKREAHSL
jgi:transposase